jgi:hypothetical protein
VFDLFSPYSEIGDSNPVFKRDRKRLRWLSTPERLRRFNQRAWLGLPIIVLCWWLLERATIDFRSMTPLDQWNLIINLLYLSVAWTLLSSLWMMTVTIGEFHRFFHSSEWELLKITPQFGVNILGAKDGAAQIRAWGVTAVEVGLRITIPFLSLLNFFYAYFRDRQNRPYFAIDDIALNPFCWLALAFMAGIALGYILESIFRMRLIVALSILIAFRIQNVTFALLTGFLIVVFIHLTQALVIGGLWRILDLNTLNPSSVVLAILCLFIPFCLIVFCCYLAIHAKIRTMLTAFNLQMISTID